MFSDRRVLIRQNYFRLGMTNFESFFDEFSVKIYFVFLTDQTIECFLIIIFIKFINKLQKICMETIHIKRIAVHEFQFEFSDQPIKITKMSRLIDFCLVLIITLINLEVVLAAPQTTIPRNLRECFVFIVFVRQND